MSLTDKLGYLVAYGAIILAGAAFPVMIPYLLAGGAIGGGSVLVGHYIFGNKYETAEPKPVLEKVTEIKTQTQTLEEAVKTPEAPAFEDAEDEIEELEKDLEEKAEKPALAKQISTLSNWVRTEDEFEEGEDIKELKEQTEKPVIIAEQVSALPGKAYAKETKKAEELGKDYAVKDMSGFFNYPVAENAEPGEKEGNRSEPCSVLETLLASKPEIRNLPTILRTPKDWKALKCPPKGNEDIYEYIIIFLSQNPELAVTRTHSLIDVQALDLNAEFYYSPDKNKIYVLGKKVPSVIENWEVYGAKYVVQDIPPVGSMQIESVVEGSLTGKYIYLENSLPDASAFLENAIDIMKYLQKGITLYLKSE